MEDRIEVYGEDGRLVQEALYAGYHSAALGAQVTLLFRPTGVNKPIDLWLARRTAGARPSGKAGQTSLVTAQANSH